MELYLINTKIAIFKIGIILSLFNYYSITLLSITVYGNYSRYCLITIHRNYSHTIELLFIIFTDGYYS